MYNKVDWDKIIPKCRICGRQDWTVGFSTISGMLCPNCRKLEEDKPYYKEAIEQMKKVVMIC